MGGIGFLLVIILYIVGSAALVAKAPTLKYKIVALLAVLLIPSADAIYGRTKLNQMCAAEGGLKVYRVAQGVEGFMASSTDEFMLNKYGFQFSEGESSPRKYYRFSKQNDSIVIEENVTPKSKYRLFQTYGDDKSVYRRSQYSIEDISSGEVLATDIRLTFKGGWAERFLARFSDAGVGNVAWCSDNPYPEVRIENLITNTLKH